MKIKRLILILMSAILLCGAFTGCGSTKSENGATIEKGNRIPFL